MPEILLIEDTINLAKVLIRDLSDAGFTVHHATHGSHAIEKHQQIVPDIVLLDWMLPDIDGIDVLKKIREHAATPVIMLTARSEEIDRVIGLEIGADDYITKPFSTRELIARIKAMLRRADLIEQTLKQDKQSSQTYALTYRNLKLDTLAYRATLDDIDLDLSRTEFDLLCLFVRNPGRAFSRAYLLDTLWDATYVGGDRAVDNVVLRLRKKLNMLGDAIETVWGVGYRLRDED